MDGHEVEGAEAIVQQRPKAKLSRDVMVEQINNYRALIFTEATRGKPSGYMAPADWIKAIGVMADAGVLPAGTNPENYYTNELLPALSN
ncbi:MAG: hypothetical protein O3A21_03780 [Proteobacteria bacterium]|nr:hypothetical protein [Pseudomonadota bacterium]